ncbi:MAG: hypothetical protein M3M94_06035, partial [Actinomycetota bacterium]|nr:hypothetical protein [Actinomycetota bacterium]
SVGAPTARPDIRDAGERPRQWRIGGHLYAPRNAPRASAHGASLRSLSQAARVGTVRNWLGLDDARNEFYAKRFRLAGVGKRVEVWVAADISFPAGDCRNTVDGGARARVRSAQVRYLIGQFDRRIYPRESAFFSRPPLRNGRRARANRAQFDPRGNGRRIVVLVDNIRDSNYYDRNNAGNMPYLAGFFSGHLTEFFDRNVMTIDAYDWLHRMGRRPPHRPVPTDLCASAPARPFLYEGVLAHEYQHLLEYYEDRREVAWVNEGLSGFAETVTGYVETQKSIYQLGNDPQVQAFLGWLSVQTPANPNPRPSGPENSLTRWNDPDGGNVLADYGATKTFMHVLSARYGKRFIGALHRNDAQGLKGLQRVLERRRVRTTARALVDDWAAAMALDGPLDRGARLRGRISRMRLRVPTLRATMNWDAPYAYARPGAPPNGSDYVRLRDAAGAYTRSTDVKSLSFSATERFARTSRRGFTLQLVSYHSRAAGPAFLARYRIAPGQTLTLDEAKLRGLAETAGDVVAAIVTFHDPGETMGGYGRYRLTVNGVVQAGG